MRSIHQWQKIALFILLGLVLGLAGCFVSGGDDDDDDDNGGSGGGGGGSGNDGEQTCNRTFAFGEGITERVEGAWTTVTPDIFSSSWRLHDAAKLDCDEFIMVGRDNSGQSGVILLNSHSAYVEEGAAHFGSDWEFLAVDAYSGTAVAVGADWSQGSGLAYVRKNGAWNSLVLPYVSGNWWLTDIALTGKEDGFAVGVDRDGVSPVLLSLEDGVFSLVTPPGAGDHYVLYAIDLADKDNGLAIGRNEELNKGAVVWLSGGTWYSATTPEAGQDWNLTGVAMLDDENGILVGRAFDSAGGVAVRFSEGTLSLLNLPFVSDDWSFSAISRSGEGALSCGTDREHEEGVIIRFEEDQWFVEARTPFALVGLRAF